MAARNSVRVPEELTRFVETTLPAIREALATYGIIGTTKLAASKPLTTHVDEWKAALVASGTTAKHADLVASRAKATFAAAKLTYWSDITANGILSKLDAMREGTKDKAGISAQTFNFYMQAVKQFCRWMVQEGRASQSPLLHLKGLNVKTDRRHDRRALPHNELLRLLDTTREAATRVGVTGAERAMLYRVAAETGLRAGELRSLTRASFNLDSDEPTVTVTAAYSKNRKESVLPLRPSTTAALKDHFANKLPAALAFPMPKPNMLVRVLRTDLEAARAAWLKEARNPAELEEREKKSNLKYRDDAGRVFDFHAFRHTFISNLAAGGVHPKTAQQLARHSTITLTMDRYSHTFRGQLSSALDVLPDLSSPQEQPLRPTGTTDATARRF
jgi:integrase